MISVCIATYNGAGYIEQQLRSILDQLEQTDEVLLVDDASTDATLERVASLRDARIQVHRNEINLGVIASFEKSIGLASGEFIFLSDQDDIWHDGKVAAFRQAFARPSAPLVVLSDARIIDQAGQVLAESFFANRGGFVPGAIANIVKNKYLGCTMAFRADLREKIMPFPPGIPMHDMWIGIVAACFSKPVFIDAVLVDYRRHQSNASPDRPQGIVQMLVWRWRLIRNLLARLLTLRSRRPLIADE